MQANKGQKGTLSSKKNNKTQLPFQQKLWKTQGNERQPQNFEILKKFANLELYLSKLR